MTVSSPMHRIAVRGFVPPQAGATMLARVAGRRPPMSLTDLRRKRSCFAQRVGGGDDGPRGTSSLATRFGSRGSTLSIAWRSSRPPSTR